MKRQYLWMVMMTISGAAFSWSGDGQVKAVYSHDGMHVVETTIEEDVCGNNGKFWWPKNDDDSSDMFSISLTALVSGNYVRFAFSSNSELCKFGAAQATHAMIRK